MKKFLKTVLCGIAASFLFYGCDNFLDGSELKDQIDSEIDYSDAAFLNVTVSADVAQGKTVPSILEDAKTYKVSDKIENLKFTANTEYQFLYWKAEPSEHIVFGDKTSASTWVKFENGLDSDKAIVITPVCADRPYPVVSPDNTGDYKPKNTPVTISFGHIIQNSEDDLKKIDIQIGGESVLSHYKTPVFTDNKRSVLFEADNDNLIDLSSGTADVSVVIPSVFYYTAADGTDVYMSGEVTSKFTIDKTTRESAEITFQIDDSNSGKLNRTGTSIVYLGDEITLIFTMTEGYQFAGWKAEMSEGTEGTVNIEDGKIYLNGTAVLEEVSNGEDFDEEYYASLNKYQKKYKVLAASENIVISPVCYKKPVVESVTPSNKEAVAKNSSIVITFSKEMTISDSDLEKITIKMDGLDASGYFETPSQTVNETEKVTQITFTAKRSPLIDISSGTKNITVTIPASFSYEEDGNKVTLGTDYSYTYAVNNTTVDSVKLSIKTVEGCSIDAVENSKTLYLDNSLTINCTPETAYEITGWKVYAVNDSDASDESGVVSDAVLQQSISTDKKSITLTTLAGIDGTVVVKPVIEGKKYVQIVVSSDYGTTIPAGSAGKYYSGDTVELDYREDSDYQFTGWTVTKKADSSYTALTDAEKEIFKFSDTEEADGSTQSGAETMNTVMNIGTLTDNYTIKVFANCAKRPKVLTNTPVYTTEGVYRDTRIKVIFTNSMSESSIYWTIDELAAMNVTEAQYSAYVASGYENAAEKKYYAYKTSAESSELTFKNIQIQKRGTTTKLETCYKSPYFEDTKNTILVIPTYSDDDLLPPAATDIEFILSRQFKNTEGITLSAEYSNCYFTNLTSDKESPVVSNCVVYDGSNELNTDNNDTDLRQSSNLVKIQKLSEDLKITVKATIKDSLSHPSNVKVSLKPVATSFYDAGEETSISQNVIMTDSTTGTADYTGNGLVFDFTDAASKIAVDGVYDVTVSFFDNNNNETKYTYRAWYDYTDPSALNNLTESRTQSGKATVSWTKTSEADIAKIKIVPTNVDCNSDENAAYIDSSGSSYDFDVTDFNHYKYTAEVYDYFGNVSEQALTSVDYTPPSKVSLNYSEGRNGRVILHYNTPSDVDLYDAVLSYDADYTQKDYQSISKDEVVNKTISGLTNGTSYDYYIRTVDFSGNWSEPVYVQEEAGALPGMICYAPENDSANIFCSKNVLTDKNPIGVVCDGSAQSAVKILALDQTQNYIYGPDNSNFRSNNTYAEMRTNVAVYGGIFYYNITPGKDWYELVRDNSYYRTNCTTNSIWYYLLSVKNVNSAVEWWVPSRLEWVYVCNNWASVAGGLKTLSNNGISAAYIYAGYVYYVSTPNYYSDRCNLVGINTNQSGNLNEHLAHSDWMEMYTTSYDKDVYYRTGSYGAYTRAMAFIDMQ